MSYPAVAALWPKLAMLLPEDASFSFKRLLLGWISTESGGNIRSTGSASLGEAGYFQLTSSDYSNLGRNPLDQTESLQAGVDFVQRHLQDARAFLDSYSVDHDEEFELKVVRLLHAGGKGMAKRMFDDMREHESLPAEFSEISDYFGNVKGIHNEADMRTRIHTDEGYLYASTQCYRVDATWAQGGAIAAIVELVPDAITGVVSSFVLGVNDLTDGNLDLVGIAMLLAILAATFYLMRKWYG